MFERRLKIFLGILAVVSLLLVARAGQVQVMDSARWKKAAVDSLHRSQLVEAVRGNIYDVKGRLIATDEACTDACVDYRALTDPPDETWVRDRAVERLRARFGDDWAKLSKKERKERIEKEGDAVRADIHRMWADLARLGGKPPEQIEEARAAIIRRVKMRRRLVWYRNYLKAREKSEQNRKLSPESESMWRRWLIEEDAPAGAEAEAENFSVTVAEQTQPHVILHAIPTEVQNELGKHADRYPGLVLRPSTHRYYPYKEAFCHGMGHVGHVSREDLLNDPNAKDETRQYLPNDLIGRGGVEGLCEQALRGTKGKIEYVLGEEAPVSRSEPVAGKDVRLSIDIELQRDLENAFTHAAIYDPKEPNAPPEIALLHGAAIVIDVPTGEVRALASYPTYDLNRFDDDYDQMYRDQLNQPLLNRATEAQLQPGSTIKPVVGLSTITQGLWTADQGIECTGFLVIDGKRQIHGRCWVESKLGAQLRALGMSSAHHPVPVPHPTGYLTFADALERSCNVYFETLADKMGIELLSVWYDRWGLGRRTGLGIPEACGRLPRDVQGPIAERRAKLWYSGIGQDPVAATPIQMANVAATIARDGVWMRPRLVSDADAKALGIHPAPPRAATTIGGTDSQPAYPDRVDLNLSKAALAAARDGMHRVTSSRAGTGLPLLSHAPPELEGIPFCGKTGTAQAAHFVVYLKDEHGKKMLDEQGKPRVYVPEPGTPGKPNPVVPWYRGGADGRDVNHAWYIGFAPADHPQVAFAVMVEYGGSGGAAGGAVAREAMTCCVRHGYLKR